jgi:drug/metabolite transporter (DMT)-like permease
MAISKILGFVVFALGVLMLVFAYDATQAPVEEITNTITGNYSDQTMWYFAAGVAAIVGGILLIAFGTRR